MTADQSNEIVYTVVFEDLLSAQRLAGPDPWIRAGLEAALFGSTCAVVGALGGSRSIAIVIGCSAALAVTYAGLALLLRRWWFVRRVGRTFRSNVSFRGVHRGRWDEIGLASETPQLQRRVSWTDIKKRRENGETVLLYQSPSIVHFIPKRVLSPAQVASLRSHLDRIPIERPRHLR